MNGIRFYADYSSSKAKRRGGDAPNALALFVDNKIPGGTCEATCATYDWPDSAMSHGATSRDYLHTSCKRISEAEARRIHPTLFTTLDRLD